MVPPTPDCATSPLPAQIPPGVWPSLSLHYGALVSWYLSWCLYSVYVAGFREITVQVILFPAPQVRADFGLQSALVTLCNSAPSLGG